MIATWDGRSIHGIEADGTRTVLADRYEGKRFGGMPKRGDDASKGLETAGIYMIGNGELSCVIEVSPDANGLARRIHLGPGD